MSWFSTGLDTLNQLTEKVQQATEKVQQVIPVDKEMLAKLTLNTDEMIAERQKFGEEAKRKDEVKNMLSGMMPWETRDTERDILVEECKEAILALSSNEDTFFGPYEMPFLDVKEGDDDDDNKSEGDDDDEDQPKESKTSKNRKPSEDSLEKLAKLEPLPPLLGDFDLDAHVGLINNLLKVDPQLVKIQSNLSGGGDRERCFWRNYFFWCAFTRYEAGLSIDEIWSYQPEENKQVEGGEQAEEEVEETVVFDQSTESHATPSEPAFPASDGTNNADLDATGSGGLGDGNSSPGTAAASSATSSSVVTDFELVGDSEGVDDTAIVDTELDELEAEIARELEED